MPGSSGTARRGGRRRAGGGRRARPRPRPARRGAGGAGGPPRPVERGDGRGAGAEGRLRRGDAGPALAARVATAIAEIGRDGAAAEARAARIAADRTLLAELESVRGGRADHGDPRRADAEYAAAFRKAGLDLDAVGPERAGEWIAAAPPAGARRVPRRLGRGPAARRGRRGGLAAGRSTPPAPPTRTPGATPSAPAGGTGAPRPSRPCASWPATGRRWTRSRRRACGCWRCGSGRPATARRRRGCWPAPGGSGRTTSGSTSTWRRRAGRTAARPRAIYPRPEEAVRHLTAAALAVRPRSAVAHHSPRHRPASQGKPDEAVAEFREAIRLEPDYAKAHTNLGNVLNPRGRWTRPSPMAHREAIPARSPALRPSGPTSPSHNLGIALAGQGKVDEAVAAFREAIRLKPDYAEAHNNLGIALAGQGKVDEAVAEHREAIRLKPDYALAHTNLGIALQAGEGGRGRRRVPRGHPAQARLRRGPLQPGTCPAGPGRLRRVARDAPPRARAGHQAARLARSLGAVGRGGRADGGAGPAATRPAQGRGSSEGHRRAPGAGPDVLRHQAVRRRRPVLGRGAGGRPEARRRPPGPAPLQRRLRRGPGRLRAGDGRPEAR